MLPECTGKVKEFGINAHVVGRCSDAGSRAGDCKTDLAIVLAIRVHTASDGFFAQIEITFDATPCVVSNTSIT